MSDSIRKQTTTRTRGVRWLVAATTLGLTLLSASGCARYLSDNPAHDPNQPLPGSWGPDATPGSTDDAVMVSAATQKQWDEFFVDPKLRALIAEALDHNWELQIRSQEVIIAGTEVAARRGEYIPRVDGFVGGGIEKVGDMTSQGVSDEANGVPEHLPSMTFGLSASWEVDLWGKLHKAAKSADLRYISSLEAKHFLVTQTVAEIADGYYDLMALDSQIEILDRFIDLQQDALEMVRLKKEAARATELAVQRFEAEVLENQALRVDLEQQRIEAENRINLLLGRYPQHVERDSTILIELEPATVESGLPAELLENRPDIREAELLLEASKLDVQVAKARFFPSLSIDAELGYESFNPRHLVATPQSLLYNVAGNLVAPLLNRAAIKADYQAANAEQIQAVLVFESRLVNAFTEVINYVAMNKNLSERFTQQQAQVERLAAAIETSNLLYRSARADYTEVLLTRRDSLKAEMELIETRKRQMQAVVGLYRALGGGWRGAESQSDAAAGEPATPSP